jgi:hypothetical protein
MMASPIMVAIDDRARRPSVKLECSPAGGTNAAVNWRDSGRSRWQLSDKITTIAGVHVRVRSTYFAMREAACVQVFGRRNAEPIHALSRPASEKRQSTKSRVGNGGGAATMGISPRAQASMWWNVAATWAILPRGMCVN